MRFFYVCIAMVLGCTKPNPNVCCTDEADCNAKGIPVGSVCEQGLVCRGNQCISEPCTTAADCDAAAPYCIAGLCAEACAEDAQCPGFGQDPSDRFCVNSACVTCRSGSDCPSSAPVCDAGACRGCNADADCESGVCDSDSATCIAEASVLYVTGNGPTSDCVRADPCSLSRAIALIDATRNVIKLGSGAHLMSDIVANKSVTIYGPGTIAGDGGTVDGSTLVAKDLEWNGSPGCVNTAANLPPNRLELRRVRVALTTNMLVGEVCEVTVSDSKLTFNGTVATPLISIVGELAGVNGATADRQSKIAITRTVLTGGDPALSVGLLGTANVTNSVFQNQGTTYGWVYVFPSSTSTNKVEFSTLYNSVLKCGVSGTGYLAMSNNIMVNARAGAPADTVTGTFCSHSYDLIRPQTTAVPGPGNKLGVDPAFVNQFTGDFHLQPGSAAVDAADPAATQAVDYDGVTRPQGTGRDIGAFEYH